MIRLKILLLGMMSFAGFSRAEERYGAWSAPENAGSIINSGANDQHPGLSPNGLNLYLVSDRAGSVPGSLAGTFDLWVSDRETPESPWGTPQNLGEVVNSIYTEYAPNLSNDGHWLFFGSDRPGGCGSRDIWASHRKNKKVDVGEGGWETPVDLGCWFNSAQFDDGPSFFQNPRTGVVTMYLTTQNRPGGLGDFDIWASTLGWDGTWATPVNVTELNSPFRDTRTAIRRDGLEMFLTSNRPGSILDATGAPSLDLWVSTRNKISDPWGPLVDMRPKVNSAFSDGAPAISRSGTELYFYSNRPGGFGSNDLYVIRRPRINSSKDSDGLERDREDTDDEHPDRSH